MSFAATVWLGRAAAAILALSLVSIAWIYLSASTNPWRRWLRNYQHDLDQHVRFLRLNLSGFRLLLLQSVALLASVFLLGVNPKPIWVLPVLAILFLPRAYLRLLRRKRVMLIEQQINTWLLVLANALKASTSLGEAIASSVAVVQAPLSQEVDLMVKEYQLGAPLDQALEAMTLRIGSRSVAGALLTLQIGRNTGGNLALILESSAASLRELARLEAVARTKTAEGKAQAFVIAVIPFPLFACLNWMDPRFFLPLTQNFTGNLVLAGAAALWLAAVLVARKVLIVDI
ncbi:MAG: type II secretion system F family protein [Deltaproteobacteria bacterium]|nr:type II secretion system F family protein [Deltaproteobacteria bacterium]